MVTIDIHEDGGGGVNGIEAYWLLKQKADEDRGDDDLRNNLKRNEPPLYAFQLPQPIGEFRKRYDLSVLIDNSANLT